MHIVAFWSIIVHWKFNFIDYSYVLPHDFWSNNHANRHIFAILSIKSYLTQKSFRFEIRNFLKLSRQDLDRIRLYGVHKSRASAFCFNYYTLIEFFIRSLMTATKRDYDLNFSHKVLILKQDFCKYVTNIFWQNSDKNTEFWSEFLKLC